MLATSIAAVWKDLKHLERYLLDRGLLLCHWNHYSGGLSIDSLFRIGNLFLESRLARGPNLKRGVPSSIPYFDPERNGD